jgi:hypothetical protein
MIQNPGSTASNPISSSKCEQVLGLAIWFPSSSVFVWKRKRFVKCIPGAFAYIRPPRLVVATSSSRDGAEWATEAPSAQLMNTLSLLAKEDFALLHGAELYHMVHQEVRPHKLPFRCSTSTLACGEGTRARCTVCPSFCPATGHPFFAAFAHRNGLCWCRGRNSIRSWRC